MPVRGTRARHRLPPDEVVMGGRALRLASWSDRFGSCGLCPWSMAAGTVTTRARWSVEVGPARESVQRDLWKATLDAKGTTMSHKSADCGEEREFGTAIFSTLPLVIILVELIAGVVLFVSGLSFVALIYTAAWGILIWHVSLRAAILLNALGATLAVVSLLACVNQERGRLLRILGLLLNVIALGLAWRACR